MPKAVVYSLFHVGHVGASRRAGNKYGILLFSLWDSHSNAFANKIRDDLNVMNGFRSRQYPAWPRLPFLRNEEELPGSEHALPRPPATPRFRPTDMLARGDIYGIRRPSQRNYRRLVESASCTLSAIFESTCSRQ